MDTTPLSDDQWSELKRRKLVGYSLRLGAVLIWGHGNDSPEIGPSRRGLHKLGNHSHANGPFRARMVPASAFHADAGCNNATSTITM
jgi:hypothetical protein